MEGVIFMVGAVGVLVMIGVVGSNSYGEGGMGINYGRE